MDEIYLNLMELLTPEQIPQEQKLMDIYNQLKRIRWVDMDKGQLEFYEVRPAVAFPCALIKVEIAKAEDLGNNVQRCHVIGTIRLAFDYVGETSAKTPQALRQQSLDYFKLVKAIYLAVQGKIGGTGNYNRQSVKEENRNDGLKVVNIPFATIFIDKSAT